MQRSFLLILLTNMLFGCTVGPKYEAPTAAVPLEWHSQSSEGMGIDSPDCFLWWESFNDPLLNSLLERAAVQNLDVYIAAARVLEAREEEKGASSALYPHIDASATYGHVQYNQKQLDRILGVSQKHKGSKNKNLNFFEIGFDADWEIDLFGKNCHDINALKAKAESSEEELRHIWITLSAEVAKNYIQLRSLQTRLDLLNKHIEAQKDHLSLAQGLYQTGFTSNIEHLQAQEQLSNLAAQKQQISLLSTKAIHRLSILLGYNPGELFEELSQPGFLPCLPYDKPIGIPSELLRRRPDILKAERDLAAATELVGSAVASLFPRISLQGFVGDIAALCTGSTTWFAGSQILQPIFNSKLLEQDVCINKIKAQQALYIYQKTVLEALEETENALASLHFELERNGNLANAQNASRETNDLMMQLYQQGLKDYPEVLMQKRKTLEAEDDYFQSQTELLFHYIALYKALGGGWTIAECAECTIGNDQEQSIIHP